MAYQIEIKDLIKANMEHNHRVEVLEALIVENTRQLKELINRNNDEIQKVVDKFVKK